MKRITTLHTYGKTYYIYKDVYGYWGIDADLIDEYGRAKVDITGINGHLSKNLSDCLDSCRFAARVTDLQVNEGYELVEAIKQTGLEIYGADAWAD